MKTYTTKKFLGVRNDVSPERYAPGDLSVGTNIELDETGKITRRLGTTRVRTGVWHSIFSCGDYGYAVVDGVLSYLDGAVAPTPILAVAGTSVAYTSIGPDTYWTDNITSGILTGASNRSWGIQPPPVISAVAAGGNMRAGNYLFTMTYVRNGEESGAPAFGELVLGVAGGIAFNALPVSLDPAVTEKNVYLSTVDGEAAYLVATLRNSDTSLTIPSTPSYGMVCRTQFLIPPPPGWVLGSVAGRVFVGVEEYFWYTLPYEYGLIDPRIGYVGFGSEVRTFAPISDGVFVGSEKHTFWLAGLDPTQWVRKVVADYGTVRGTEVVIPNTYVQIEGVTGDVIGWMSARGLCLGMDGGQMKNTTGQRYIPPVARQGASLLKVRGQSPQVVSTLFD